MLRFVTIEGGDGSGKSRQLGLLDEYLDSRGVSRLLTREPGDTPLGKQLRKLVLEGRPESLSDETELFLILADRAQHVHEVVRPAIEQGKLVMSDRFVDSTLAYQGYGRGMDLALLRRLNLVATGGTMPELTIILDCPVEVALERAAERQDRQASRENRFEAEGVAFQRRVREGFPSWPGPNLTLPCGPVRRSGDGDQEKLRRIVDDWLGASARR